MVLNSDDAPDLMEYNKGNATAGLLSKQGLLTDLTAEATKRGWDKKLSPSLQTTARYDDDGVMGSGKWYGVPNYAEYVMVYYNKDLFEKHGVAVPDHARRVHRRDGHVRRQAASRRWHRRRRVPGPADPLPARAVQGRPGVGRRLPALQGQDVDFHDAALTYGARDLRRLGEEGLHRQELRRHQGRGHGRRLHQRQVSRSWSPAAGGTAGSQSEIKDFEWGTFLFPGNTLHAGSGGNLWVVPESAKTKDLAYDFIDITMSQEIQNLLGNNGGVPVAADPAAITDAEEPRS